LLPRLEPLECGVATSTKGLKMRSSEVIIGGYRALR
jgi:hypothetical protein